MWLNAYSFHYRLGQLQVGDRILAINGERLLDVTTTHEAYKLVQEGGDAVTMEIEFDVTGNHGNRIWCNS